jgi:predicted RNA-binding protein with PUA-like domain
VDQKLNYYLLKSEPSAYSIQDIQKDVEEEWDGVRNFQARNNLRSMKVGDLAYFYHSSCSVPGIVGTVHIVREAEPDLTALDPNHQGYDAKSTPENCRWDAVRVRFGTIFQEPVTLQELKTRAQNEEIIGSLSLLRQSRLSVHELTEDQWNAIQALAGSNIEN